MPQPPQFDDLDEIKFITNYFLQGCVPPFNLLAEFSQEPLHDLYLLVGTFDIQDIVKSWLRPRRERYRSSKRHGRKRWGTRVVLDVNEYVSTRIRPDGDLYPGVKLPGSRAAFWITDQVDRLNFSAAIIEEATDVGFETLWGILSAHPEHCPNYAFVNAHQTGPQVFVGVAPPDLPIQFPVKDNGQFFEGPTPAVFTTFTGEFTACFSAEMTALSAGGVQNGRFTIRSGARGIIGESSHVNLGPGESITLNVSAECEPGEFVFCARSVTAGSIRVEHGKMFAFAGTWL
jgi:hypothetical protein